MKHTIARGIVFAFLLMPLIASAQSIDALKAQAAALLAQINAIQQGSGTAGTVVSSNACPNIGRTLRLGSSGVDVSNLQQFLAQIGRASCRERVCYPV